MTEYNFNFGVREGSLEDKFDGFKLVSGRPILLRRYDNGNLVYLDSYLDQLRIAQENNPSEIKLIPAHQLKPEEYSESEQRYFMFFRRSQ